MLRTAKAAIAGLVRQLGYELIPATFAPTMDAALARLSRRVPVRTLIDVGASDGRWTRNAFRHFPETSALLVEAQGGPHGDALRRFAQLDRRVCVVIAAAGDRAGEIYFDASEPFSGAAVRQAATGSEIKVPMTTIDAEVARLGLEPPYLLKLDTHGFEAPILEGARQTIAAANALIIEAYNFTLRDGALRFHELCDHLDQRGFRCADLADPMWRERDGLLWQMDLFFLPKARPEFAQSGYR
jgi:FkbM family methyltransferase